MRPLSVLVKLKFILSLILLLPLTAFKYRKAINKRPHLHHALVNLNTLLYPLGYITVQVVFKAILITPCKTTLITSTLRT